MVYDVRKRSPVRTTSHLLQEAEDFHGSPSWLYAIERGEIRLTTTIARGLQSVYRPKLRRGEDLVAYLIELDEQPYSPAAS